jgi:glycosyltransferase involved in cell wall biosynthesis
VKQKFHKFIIQLIKYCINNSILKYVENISVLMPVKNGSKFLSEAMKFISQNILPNDEVIIVNDNSTDNTLELLTDWVRGDSRIIVINNHSPGLVNALNLGLQHCTNNWIARFDVDDAYAFQRLSKQRSLISPEKVAIFSDYWVVSENGKFLGKIPSGVTNFGVRISLLHGRRTPHPSVIMNRDKVLKAGLYKLDEFPAEDLGLWLRLSTLGEFCSVPEPLLFYNLRASSVTLTDRKLAVIKRNHLIKNYFMKNDRFLITPNEYYDLVESYRKLDDGFERYLIFCSEVFLSRKYVIVPKEICLNMLWSLMYKSINKKGFKTYFHIMHGILLRWWLRKSFTKHG